MTDGYGERVARLEAQMEPLLDVPEALARLEGKVDQVLSNGHSGKGSRFNLLSALILAVSSAFVSLLVVILTHALGK